MLVVLGHFEEQRSALPKQFYLGPLKAMLPHTILAQTGCSSSEGFWPLWPRGIIAKSIALDMKPT